MADDNLNAGFTGTPAEKATGVRRVAQNAGEIARNEAQAVVAGVTDHPHTASTLVLGIGALAFGLGYLLGRSSSGSSSYGYWR
jgi:hypothetical protein